MILNLEGVGILTKDGQPVGMIRREDKTGHQVFYKCVEMGIEDIQELFDDGMLKVDSEHFDKNKFLDSPLDGTILVKKPI